MLKSCGKVVRHEDVKVRLTVMSSLPETPAV